MEDIKISMKSLKNNRTQGPGRIKLFQILNDIFQRVVDTRNEISKEWKQAFLTSLFNRRKCENYIGTIGRLYAKVLKNKLEDNIKNLIGEDHAGFIAAKSCIDHIYSLIRETSKNQPIHCAFIDLKKHSIEFQKLEYAAQ